MCEILQIPRSTYYYEAKERDTKEELTELIKLRKENQRLEMENDICT